jgi:precorrin-2 methylase
VLLRRDESVLALIARATREQLGVADDPIPPRVEPSAPSDASEAESEPPSLAAEVPAGSPLPEMAVMVRIAPFAEGTAGDDLRVSYVASLHHVPHPANVDDVALAATAATPATAFATSGATDTADITIVGLGLAAGDHLTPEAERALRAANEVLYLDAGVATSTLLGLLNARVTPLFAESYAEDEPRLDAYAHMTARVLDAATDHAPIAFAVHGHPLVGVHAPFAVAAAAAERGLTVRVLPGISALDALLADLGIDPVVMGIQMFEATDLLLRRRPLQPDVPAVIWQVGNLESRLHTSRPSRSTRFARFRDHLLRFYPGDHPVTIYYAPPHPLVAARIVVVRLADLPSEAGQLHAGVTLYLPPAFERPIVDLELLGVIDDPVHLNDITH